MMLYRYARVSLSSPAAGPQAAQARGGALRRVLVHGAAAGAAAALATYAACAGDSPAAGGRLLRVQAAWRGRRARAALEREGHPVRTASGARRAPAAAAGGAAAASRR